VNIERKRTQLRDIGLRGQPFHTSGLPTKFVQYHSQRAAFRFLNKILTDNRGIGLLYGPESSGKSVLIHQFVHKLPADLTVAVVDGTRLKTAQILSKILAKFGYEIELDSVDELLNLLSVLLVQQTRAYQPPLLILENIDNMYPSALSALCKLAALTAHRRFALRIILVSNRDIRRVLKSRGMNSIAERLIGEFELGPLTAKEALIYLYAKLQACGVDRPDGVFPVDICDKLHLASGGLPGKLDGIAMSTIDRASNFPVQPEDIDDPAMRKQSPRREDSVEAKSATNHESPQLMVTLNGKTLQEFKLTDSKVLIGRSVLSDIVINNQFVGKHHALLIRVQDAIVIVDLKSTNGTFVNSHRVRSSVLRHDDIISLGDYRIKVIYPRSRARMAVEDFNTADTATMKSIADIRRRNARQNVQFADIGKQKA